MSRWAEFLGDDYMSSHGKFVPYENWANAFNLAFRERGVEDGNGAVDVRQCYEFCLYTKHQYSSFSNFFFSTFNSIRWPYINPQQPFSSIEINYWKPFNYLSAENITDLLGEPLLAPPQKFTPTPSEYLWQCKRILDCCIFRDGHRLTSGDFLAGDTFGQDHSYALSYGDAISRMRQDVHRDALSSVGVEVYGNPGGAWGTWEVYTGYDVNLRCNEYDLWFTPSAYDRLIFAFVRNPGRYWNPYGLEENSWNKVGTVHCSPDSSIQSINLFPNLYLPEEEIVPKGGRCGWIIEDFAEFADLRPGLEFYDPI